MSWLGVMSRASAAERPTWEPHVSRWNILHFIGEFEKLLFYVPEQLNVSARNMCRLNNFLSRFFFAANTFS